MTVTFADKLARMPHYEAGLNLSEAREAYETDDVVKLASNECPWPPHPAVLEVVAKEAAGAHRYSKGMPFVYPSNELSYSANFLQMVKRIAEPKFEVHPEIVRALAAVGR